jgi:hypothetical protein
LSKYKKMRYKVLAFFLCFVALTSFGQEKIVYDAHAEKRESGSFHAIKVSHGIELLVKQGAEEAVAISADTREQREAVKTEVVGGELRIYVKQNLQKWWQQLRAKGVRVKAYVSFKTLDGIDGTSGSKTIIDGHISSPSLSVNLSSGASLQGDIQVQKADIDVSSGARGDMGGTADDMDIRSSSGAHFYGYDLLAQNAKADASSGGKIEISIVKDLSASASSGGGITYKGNGSAHAVSTSTGGKVRKEG